MADGGGSSAVGADAAYDHEGYVLMEGHKMRMKTWKKRYLRLREGPASPASPAEGQSGAVAPLLSWFHSAEDYEPRQVVCLRPAANDQCTVRDVHLAAQTNGGKRYEHFLEIQWNGDRRNGDDQDRVVRMAFDRKEEFTLWLTLLRAAQSWQDRSRHDSVTEAVDKRRVIVRVAGPLCVSLKEPGAFKSKHFYAFEVNTTTSGNQLLKSVTRYKSQEAYDLDPYAFSKNVTGRWLIEGNNIFKDSPTTIRFRGKMGKDPQVKEITLVADDTQPGRAHITQAVDMFTKSQQDFSMPTLLIASSNAKASSDILERYLTKNACAVERKSMKEACDMITSVGKRESTNYGLYVLILDKRTLEEEGADAVVDYLLREFSSRVLALIFPSVPVVRTVHTLHMLTKGCAMVLHQTETLKVNEQGAEEKKAEERRYLRDTMHEFGLCASRCLGRDRLIAQNFVPEMRDGYDDQPAFEAQRTGEFRFFSQTPQREYVQNKKEDDTFAPPWAVNAVDAAGHPEDAAVKAMSTALRQIMEQDVLGAEILHEFFRHMTGKDSDSVAPEDIGAFTELMETMVKENEQRPAQRRVRQSAAAELRFARKTSRAAMLGRSGSRKQSALLGRRLTRDFAMLLLLLKKAVSAGTKTGADVLEYVKLLQKKWVSSDTRVKFVLLYLGDVIDQKQLFHNFDNVLQLLDDQKLAYAWLAEQLILRADNKELALDMLKQVMADDLSSPFNPLVFTSDTGGSTAMMRSSAHDEDEAKSDSSAWKAEPVLGEHETNFLEIISGATIGGGKDGGNKDVAALLYSDIYGLRQVPVTKIFKPFVEKQLVDGPEFIVSFIDAFLFCIRPGETDKDRDLRFALNRDMLKGHAIWLLSKVMEHMVELRNDGKKYAKYCPLFERVLYILDMVDLDQALKDRGQGQKLKDNWAKLLDSFHADLWKNVHIKFSKDRESSPKRQRVMWEEDKSPTQRLNAKARMGKAFSTGLAAYVCFMCATDQHEKMSKFFLTVEQAVGGDYVSAFLGKASIDETNKSKYFPHRTTIEEWLAKHLVLHPQEVGKMLVTGSFFCRPIMEILQKRERLPCCQELTRDRLIPIVQTIVKLHKPRDEKWKDSSASYEDHLDAMAELYGGFPNEFERLLGIMAEAVVKAKQTDITDLTDGQYDFTSHNFRECLQISSEVFHTASTVADNLQQIFKDFTAKPPHMWTTNVKALESIVFFLRFLNKEDLQRAQSKFREINEGNDLALERLEHISRDLYSQAFVALDADQPMTSSQFSQIEEQITYDDARTSEDDMELLKKVVRHAIKMFQERFSCPMLPHHTQIIAVLMCVIHHNDQDAGQGLIAQMGTGEGKSLVLAMLACFFALKGQKVTVLVDNAALKDRDYANYFQLFQMLQLSSSKSFDEDKDICYSRKQDLFIKIMDLTVEGRPIDFENRVLVVDEVDGLLLDSQSTSEWRNVDSDKTEHMKAALDARKDSATSAPAGVSFELWEEAQDLYQNAMGLTMDDDIKYVHDAQRYYYLEAGVPDMEVDDDILSARNYLDGMEGATFAMRSLDFIVAQSHMLKKFRRIFGLTGSLGNEAEQKLLKAVYQCDVYKVPRFLETCRDTQFKEKVNLGCHISSSRRDHIDNVCKRAVEKSAGDSQVPVLVIVKHEDDCEAFKANIETRLRAEGVSTDNGKCLIIHQTLAETNSDKFDKRVVMSTKKRKEHHDCRITITTDFGGRGIDYRVVDDEIDGNGGLLVIIAYLPPKERDHIQFLGRTGRQDKYGQYMYVLNRSDYPGTNFEEDGEDEDIEDAAELQKFAFAQYPEMCLPEGNDVVPEPLTMTLSAARNWAAAKTRCVGFTFEATPQQAQLTDDSEVNVYFKQGGVEDKIHQPPDEDGYTWHVFEKFRRVEGEVSVPGEIQHGYLRADEQASDRVKEQEMTWEQAVAYCENNVDVVAFTCQTPNPNPEPTEIVFAMFKSHDDVVEQEWPESGDLGWLTYKSTVPDQVVTEFPLERGERRILDKGNEQSLLDLAAKCEEIELGEAMNAVCDRYYGSDEATRSRNRTDFLQFLQFYTDYEILQVMSEASRIMGRELTEIEPGRIARDFGAA